MKEILRFKKNEYAERTTNGSKPLKTPRTVAAKSLCGRERRKTEMDLRFHHEAVRIGTSSIFF